MTPSSYNFLHACRRTARDRFTSEEAKMLDRLQNDMYKEVRIAAEAHRQVIFVKRYLDM